jgi:hypothetical protein
VCNCAVCDKLETSVKTRPGKQNSTQFDYDGCEYGQIALRKEKNNICPMSFECLRERVSGILRYRIHMLNRRKNRTQEMSLSHERKILGK